MACALLDPSGRALMCTDIRYGPGVVPCRSKAKHSKAGAGALAWMHMQLLSVMEGTSIT
jgi:hypothetical protein